MSPSRVATHQDVGVISGSFSERQIQVGARLCWNYRLYARLLTASLAHCACADIAQILHRRQGVFVTRAGCFRHENAHLKYVIYSCTRMHTTVNVQRVYSQ